MDFIFPRGHDIRTARLWRKRLRSWCDLENTLVILCKWLCENVACVLSAHSFLPLTLSYWYLSHHMTCSQGGPSYVAVGNFKTLSGFTVKILYNFYHAPPISSYLSLSVQYTWLRLIIMKIIIMFFLTLRSNVLLSLNVCSSHSVRDFVLLKKQERKLVPDWC
jgi:hypothetical protein